MAKRKSSRSPLFYVLVVVLGMLGIGLTVYLVNSSNSQNYISKAAKAPTPPSTITMDQNPNNLTVGSTVTFKTQVYGLKGWEYPMVQIVCFQDVNKDEKVDTNLLGPDIVFSWLDHPDATFTLGGYSSIWTLRGGGPATCIASLMSYGWHGQNQIVRTLDELPVFYTK